MSGADELTFWVIGHFVVRRGGRVADLGGGLPRRLLGFLLVHRAAVVAESTLIEVLWGPAPPSRPAASIQPYVSRLRTALGDEARSVLARVGDGYLLDVPAESVDANVAENLLKQARALLRVDPGAALVRARAAAKLWRGPVFADLGTEIEDITTERTRLEELHQQVEELRLAAQLATGDSVGVVADLQTRTTAHPYREVGWELLVAALSRSGRQVDALAALRAVRKILDDDLGVVPGAALQQLEHAVLTHDAALLSGSPDWSAELMTADQRRWARTAAPLPRFSVPATIARPQGAFIGRRDEMALLRQTLNTHRLVTVIGPGGVGKTRLALELAATRDSPVWTVALAETHEPGFVWLATAAAIGLSSFSGDPGDAVIGALRQRNGLLLLDHCEHALDEVCDLVTAILRSATELRVLTTSREPLQLDGETLIGLDPLKQGTDGAAVSLLTDRIIAKRPGWTPASADLAHLTRIAAALDGLLLALELAAARSRLVSLADLADHIEELLTGSSRVTRGGVSPHASLAAAIDWSVALLRPRERAVWTRLSPFEGGFTADAAKAVTGHADGMATLAALVDRSMLSADTTRSPTRFRVLEPMRSRSARLDPDVTETRLAHARWIRSLAAQMHQALRGSTGPRLSRRLEEELPNLRAALAHDLVADPAAALATVGNLDWWYRRGHAGEALNWAGRALAAAPQAPPARIALAHSVMAISHLLLGQPAAAHQPLHAAAAALERADPADPFTRHVACLLAFYRSAAALFTGDLPVAETLSVQASAISRDVGEPVMEAAADTVRGTVATLQGRSADAESLLLSATRRSQEFGYRWGVAWSGRQLAGVYVTQGRHQAALDVIRTAIASSLEEHDDTSTLACLLVAARVFAHLGRLDDAGALLAATQAYAAHAGLQPTLAEPTSIGDLHTLLRDRPSPPRHAPAGPVSTGSLSDIVSFVVPT